eukprot:637835-Pleurochrysis_carterae.AAC.3
MTKLVKGAHRRLSINSPSQLPPGRSPAETRPPSRRSRASEDIQTNQEGPHSRAQALDSGRAILHAPRTRTVRCHAHLQMLALASCVLASNCHAGAQHASPISTCVVSSIITEHSAHSALRTGCGRLIFVSRA